jgi:hypothetical protein
MGDEHVSSKTNQPNLRGFIVVGEYENYYPWIQRCACCHRKRLEPDPNSDYLFSIIMFAGEADYMSYFQGNPSLRVITDAKHLFNLDLEYTLAGWLKSDIRITHFAFLNRNNCYAVTWTHSMPPPRSGYNNSIQMKEEVESCIKMEKLVKRTPFIRDIKNIYTRED